MSQPGGASSPAVDERGVSNEAVTLQALSNPVGGPDEQVIAHVPSTDRGRRALMTWAAGLVYWRLQSPLSPARAYGYIAAAALMAFSPGLFWFTAWPMLASIAFHGGLLSGLVLAFRDDGFRR